jgi:hypothetical protein
MDVPFDVRLASGQTHRRIFDRTESTADVRAWVAALAGMPEDQYALRIDPGGKEFPAGPPVALAAFAPACSLRVRMGRNLWIVDAAKDTWPKLVRWFGELQFIADPRGDPADFWRATSPQARRT